MDKFLRQKILPYCDFTHQTCRPIFDLLGVNGFSFQKIYEDGSRLYFSSSPEWIEYLIKSDWWLSMVKYGKYSRFCKFTLWKHWPHEDEAFHNHITDSREIMECDNGLTIIKKREGYLDSFALRAHKDNESVNNLYLNHLEEIEQFMSYFLLKAAPLIAEAEKNKIVIPKGEENKSLSSSQPSGVKNENFSRVMIKAVAGEQFLTKRESQCVIYILKGKSAKQIGRIFNLSYRTVETHLESAKQKIGVKDKASMIDSILEFEHNRRLFLMTLS